MPTTAMPRDMTAQVKRSSHSCTDISGSFRFDLNMLYLAIVEYRVLTRPRCIQREPFVGGRTHSWLLTLAYRVAALMLNILSVGNTADATVDQIL
jgi:hypothetical protein